MIDVLMMAGTGHGTTGEDISDTFGKMLRPNHFQFTYIPYPATYGGGEAAYAESTRKGYAALLGAAQRRAAEGREVVFGGYSQGAEPAGRLAADAAAGTVPLPNIVGCALIADPYRPAGAGGTELPPAQFSGILPPRSIPSRLPSWYAAAPGDPITALPPGNPLRSVADLTEWFSLRTPEDAIRWGADCLRKIAEGRLQPWWRPEHWRDWGGALAYANGYLFDGRHTAAYIREGHVEALAEAVSRELT